LSLLKQRPIEPQTVAKLREAQCGFEGRNPKVCCPKSPSEVVAPSPIELKITPPEQDLKPEPTKQPSAWESHPKARLIPADECGIDNSQKIWGGNRTDMEQYPWTALLQYETCKCSNKAKIVPTVVG
jgi:transmembrane serine protease 9